MSDFIIMAIVLAIFILLIYLCYRILKKIILWILSLFKKDNDIENQDSFSYDENTNTETGKKLNTEKKKNNEITVIGNDFLVCGEEKEYWISFKNNQLRFLVRNGEIVGMQDKSKSNKIYMYESK